MKELQNFLKSSNILEKEFATKLLESESIFLEIFTKCGNKFEQGTGSYLFDGISYEYYPNMFKKQVLLFEKAKTCDSVLEIGTYMGHSLLIMLLANPKIKITCVDISDEYAVPAINVLIEKLNADITFIKGDSLTELSKLNQKYDMFHIDGAHYLEYVEKEFNLCANLSSSDIIRVVFDDYNAVSSIRNILLKEYTIIKQMTPHCDWNNSYFELQKRTELCHMMTRHGSDKGTGRHNYTILYDELFKDRKDEKLNVFELGLGTNNPDVPSNMGPTGIPGASLRGWREYFPNSNIFGADVDRRILFNENRISTFYCDQRDSTVIKDMWNNEILNDLSFDIIVEDGLHEFYANLIFLENSLYKLNNGGIYICEDLREETVESFRREIKTLEKKYLGYTFELFCIESADNPYNDNNLLVVKKSI